MTSISSAISQIGLAQPAGAELVFARIEPGKKPKHALLAALASHEIDKYSDLYLASGAFRPGSIKADGTGRTAENVTSVLTIPFDCDLHDYLGIPKEDVIAMEDDEIYSFIEDLKTDATKTFIELGIPIHRMDYTGHGICIHIYMRDAQPEHTAPLNAAHKQVIARINDHVGYQMVDPSRSDPGSALSRLPGSTNTKNPDKPRTVTTLIPLSPLTFRLTPGQFIALAGTAPRIRTERAKITIGDNELSNDLAADIIETIAPLWKEGSRHDIALGLCGMLAKAGVPMEQTADIIATVSAGDTESWDRLTAVKTTYKRMASGQDVIGFYSLQRSIGAETLQYISSRLDAFTRTAKAPVLIAGGKRTGQKSKAEVVEEAVNSIEFEDVPEDAYHGWFREYRDLMAPTTEASDNYHLIASAVLVGALMGKRIYTEHADKRLHGNLFALLIGKAGSSRKDTAMERAAYFTKYEIMRAGDLHTTPFQVMSGYGSGEKLVGDLAEYPNILWMETEATSIFANMKRESTKTLRDKLIEAWDTRDVIRNNVKKDGAEAKNAYLSLITATQPSRFSGSVSTDDITSGLLSRMIFVPGSPKPRKASPPSPNRSVATALYQRIRDAIRQYGTEPGQMDPHLRFDDEAQAVIDDWYMTSPDYENEDMQSITVRYELHIRKLALIFAVSDASPKIRLPHLNAALSFIRWQSREVAKMLPGIGEMKEDKIEKRVFEVLKKFGPQTRRELQQRCRNSGKWSTKDWSSVLDVMERNGMVEMMKDEKGAIRYQVAA